MNSPTTSKMLSTPVRPVKKPRRLPRSLDILYTSRVNLETAFDAESFDYELEEIWYSYNQEMNEQTSKNLCYVFKNLTTTQRECPCCNKIFQDRDLVQRWECCKIVYHSNCFYKKRNPSCTKCQQPLFSIDFVQKSSELKRRYPHVEGILGEEFFNS